MELTSKQRAQLRGLANTIDTIIADRQGWHRGKPHQAGRTMRWRPGNSSRGRVLDNNIEYDARLAAQELAKATRSEVVQVIGTQVRAVPESHSKPKEKRIQLVKAVEKLRRKDGARAVPGRS
ncbi:MAG: ribosome assembly RNA-binding protein YhbY [Dysosmobacter sp.]